MANFVLYRPVKDFSKLDIVIPDFLTEMIGWSKRLSLILGAKEQT